MKHMLVQHFLRSFINFLKLLHNVSKIQGKRKRKVFTPRQKKKKHKTVKTITTVAKILAKHQSDFFLNVVVPAMFPDYLGMIALP